MNDMQKKWNSRWHEKAGSAPWQADPWLLRVLPLLPPGRALDIASGIGRNALFLAEKGYAVTAVDISDVALTELARESGRRGLSITTLQLDLEEAPQIPPGPFDLLLNFCYLHRPLLPRVVAEVRRGGVAVLRTFSQAGEERFGPIKPDFSLRPGELLDIFSTWEVLLHEEGLEPSKKGGSLAGIVARQID